MITSSNNADLEVENYKRGFAPYLYVIFEDTKYSLFEIEKNLKSDLK